MFRHTVGRIYPKRFAKNLKALSYTKYTYSAKDGHAPAETNCVTAVRFLFRESKEVFIPPVFIGDMPRTLLSTRRWTLLKIPVSKMRLGDLIFLRRRADHVTQFNERYITHIGVAMGPWTIYHSSGLRSGGRIENWRIPQDSYAHGMAARVIDAPELVLRYTDPRNTKARAELNRHVEEGEPMHEEFFPYIVDRLPVRGEVPRSVFKQ